MIVLSFQQQNYLPHQKYRLKICRNLAGLNTITNTNQISQQIIGPKQRKNKGVKQQFITSLQQNDTAVGSSLKEMRSMDNLKSSQNGSSDGGGAMGIGWFGVQGPRSHMEDVISIVRNGPCGYAYAGVFDGHGGPAAADWLQENLLTAIQNVLEKQEQMDTPVECEIIDEYECESGICCPVFIRQVLVDSFHQADDKLLRFLETQTDDIRSQAGSTATVALVRNDKLVIANVGDSRAVLCRDDNKFLDLSNAHRVWGTHPNCQFESDRVIQAGGWIKDGRVCDILAISRAFGDWEFKGAGLPDLLSYGVKEGLWSADFADGVDFKSDPIIATPDVTEVRVTEDDQALIVASDGLWDVMDSLEVTRYVRQHFTRRRDPQWIAEGLANLAIKRYTSDNVAVVIVDMWGGERWAKAAEARKSRSQLFGIF
eukprot:TRINITY_DN10041_c0_g1_i3.p1 TRINITY_DN10041_c0_g1~~TRINITY_DN10041_c0_g1_i3.p1  ORF type:complete len:427 (-),score=69.65 TRINITY_DN10041_c0_g1_i3:604-1884(-)